MTRVADCRYAGQSHELRLPLPAGADAATALHEAHRVAYGYAMPDEQVEVVTLRVIAEARPALDAAPPVWAHDQAGARRRRRIGVDGQRMTAQVLDRAALAPGDTVDGPALVEQADSTTLLGPGDRARVDRAGNLVVSW